MYTSTDVGKRLGVHANTIRTWSDRYKAHLSAGAVSGNRLYTDADLRVLATAAHYRQLGIPLDEVAGILADGKLIDELPPEPSPEMDAARASVQLVPRDQLHRALDEVQRLQTERERLLSDRDADKKQITDLNERIGELRQQIGTIQGKLDVIERDRRPATFWLVVLAAAVAVAMIATALLLLAGRVG